MGLYVKELVKSYGGRVVVDHLSFSMEKPGVYALLGTNGAGKTTSIRMILDMLVKDSGEVIFNDKPLSTDTTNVGYLAEERGLYPKVTLMDQVLYFASLKKVPKKEAEKRIKYWAERLKLEEYFYPKAIGKKKPKPFRAEQLSKGNQQKVQLMAALISDPEIIILDEPLSGLDPVNTNLFRDIIHEEASKDKYIIMSSHQMATIEEFCSDLTILNRGKAVLQGNLNEIKKGYGRVNLFVKAEGDITSYVNKLGLNVVEVTPEETRIKLENEEQAKELLKELVANNIPVVRFELAEPSLHEIFVEKVGEINEEE
ncbi:MAG: ATP-binding cassette domain-containing protein [Lachnospiraceae bacterium]|nr:ATP-binding cassette domain-containing protein [Lachnospiraceae bacterium]MBR6275211.1 ATP-binding cassette domain-containing protein [Lachnospiraceae bacterium]